ncbi:MAG: hypothetical protein ACP5IE_07805, partial [Infirmifilum sp.]
PAPASGCLARYLVLVEPRGKLRELFWHDTLNLLQLHCEGWGCPVVGAHISHRRALGVFSAPRWDLKRDLWWDPCS